MLNKEQKKSIELILAQLVTDNSRHKVKATTSDIMLAYNEFKIELSTVATRMLAKSQDSLFEVGEMVHNDESGL